MNGLTTTPRSEMSHAIDKLHKRVQKCRNDDEGKVRFYSNAFRKVVNLSLRLPHISLFERSGKIIRHAQKHSEGHF